MAAKIEHIPTERLAEETLSLPDMFGLDQRRTDTGSALQAEGTLGTHDDTVRWPIWKSATLVIGICGTFWVCAGAALLKLLG